MEESFAEEVVAVLETRMSMNQRYYRQVLSLQGIVRTNPAKEGNLLCGRFRAVYGFERACVCC